ncbi:hypothetical protein WR25_06058 [Diploscapter pachys]|uniref:Dopey N-terminal domain-containing protein n=1 Tax=Diploscapter pachys TaxID=2018661 RepID=A0A2A2J340_9BILA|nr:hypothetical protein WR25_06058 [Diploscapter pachys]
MDCARHDDLPGIIQMLCAMLMNPVTARISIQYVRLESRLTKERCPSLPADVSVVTLATADGKHRMFHVVGKAIERPWLSDVRNRLLLSTEQQDSGKTSFTPIPTTSDVPIFDDEEDTDSLEYGLEDLDPAVIEVMQYLVEMTCEEEEMASGMMTASATEEETQKIIEAIGGAENIPPTGTTAGPIVWKKLEASSNVNSSIGTGQSANTDQKHPVRPMRVGDTVNRLKKGHRRQDSLQESIFTMTEKDLKSFDTTDILRPSESGENNAEALFSDLYVHLLLYGESGRVVDLGRAEGAFRILSALIRPRTFSLSRQQLLRCLVSSGTATNGTNCFGDGTSQNGGSLVELMTKHVRAILGQHFWSPASDEDAVRQRHITLLELIITICLHFLRSFFLDSPVSPVTEEDLLIACKCKIAALDLLCDIFDELCEMLKEQQSRAFVLFVQAVLSRSKMQKSILHFLMTSVSEPRLELEPNANIPLAVSVCEFNESMHGNSKRLSAVMAVYQRCLLALTGQAIRLECDIKNGLTNFTDESLSSANRIILNEKLYMPTSTAANANLAKNPPIVELRAFVLTLLNALKRRPKRHETWLQLIVHIVPWLERSLPTLLVRIAEQLCKNINTSLNTTFAETDIDRIEDKDFTDLPANYIEMLMEMLTTLVHYCIASDAAPLGSAVPQPNITQSPPSNSTSVVGQVIYTIPGTKAATEVFSSFVKVFSSNDSSSSAGIAFSKMDMRHRGEMWKQARNDMLTSLPHILATICDLWSVVRVGQQPCLPVGSPQRLNRLILELLSPIASFHQHALLAALSLVWLSRSNSLPLSDEASFEYSSSQLDVTHLVFSLKDISFDRLVAVVADTLKDVGTKSAKIGNQLEKASFPNETPLLELLHSHLQLLPVTTLLQRWMPLLALLCEAPLASLNPRAIFLLFKLLCHFVRNVGAAQIVEDKAMSRALQEACQKLTDAINGIVAWQLETTTWLKRTLVVKSDLSSTAGFRSHDSSPSVESISLSASVQAASELAASNRGSTASLLINKSANGDIGTPVAATNILTDKRSSSNLRASLKDTNNNKRDPAYSTQALFLLANNLAELIDSICRSDDKEKMIPTLQAVWNNVVPYLKAKNARNARFFFASSKLLAAMSSFSYTRAVWKKTTLELLLDTSFFKMDRSSLQQWLVVADHLMSHDKTSFKDLLKSISYTPNASFSLMTTKEQEYELRAQALKRLAFVVFGSQLDQYSTQSNDILEKLTENLRVSQCAAIRSAVFLCVRVLLLRLRPNSLTGVWPLMVSELVTALLQLEQQLSNDNDQDGGEKESESWMQLHLAAAKLLETLFTLPAGYLSQFQMCNWTFMPVVSSDRAEIFVPFAVRISNLLEKRYGRMQSSDVITSSPSLFHIKMLTSYDELKPFFHLLATKCCSYKTAGNSTETKTLGGNTVELEGLSHKQALQRLEHSLYIDFAEHWQL